MRLSLKLRPGASDTTIPINYQHPLSAIIYKLLSHSSQEYAGFLHNKGYLGPDGKLRKLFTFSRLLIRPRAVVLGDRLRLGRHHDISLYISSPMIEDFFQHLVVGLFQDQTIEVANGGARGKLFVEEVRVCPVPEFTSRQKFKALSPIVVTKTIETKNGLGKHYVRPDEADLSDLLRQSLIRKHMTIHATPPADRELSVHIDADYLKRKGGAEKTMTLVLIKQGQAGQTNIKGFLAPFTLTGSTELMTTAWEAGLGDQCSLGFGCVEVVETKSLI